MLASHTDQPPVWLLVVKAALLAMLIVGAVAPEVGGFAGKAMNWRLLVFSIPAAVAPVLWLARGRTRYSAALDMALTVPFMLDTLGNAVGAYDNIAATDDILHFVNWTFLICGITALIVSHSAASPRWLHVTAGAGVGAAAIIFWEIAEYGIMQSGVGGLDLTYGDTLGDLALSTFGGLVGAIISFHVYSSRPVERPTELTTERWVGPSARSRS